MGKQELDNLVKIGNLKVELPRGKNSMAWSNRHAEVWLMPKTKA